MDEQHQRALQGKMNNMRPSALPELSGVVGAMDEFLRLADEEIDAAALDSFGPALTLITQIRDRVWDIQRQVEPDTLGRFLHRKAATVLGLIILAVAELPAETIDAQLQRLENSVKDGNAAVHARRAAAERAETQKREAEMMEKVRRTPVEQIVREAEADGTKLSVDAEERIIVHGSLTQGARLAISSKREKVVGFLRGRQTPSALL